MANIQQVANNFTATGQFGNWLKFDWYEHPFDLSLLISTDGGVANPLGINYVLDDGSNAMRHQVLFSQTTTVITVTDNGPPIPVQYGGNLGHGLAVNDFVELEGPPGVAGVYNVATIVSGTQYTVTSAVSQTIAAQITQAQTGKCVATTSAGDHIIGTTNVPAAGVTVRTAFGVTAPIWAAQLITVGTFIGAAVSRLVSIQGGR